MPVPRIDRRSAFPYFWVTLPVVQALIAPEEEAAPVVLVALAALAARVERQAMIVPRRAGHTPVLMVELAVAAVAQEARIGRREPAGVVEAAVVLVAQVADLAGDHRGYFAG